jgi:hypothetical protein
MKGHIMSALLAKLMPYTVDPNTPDEGLREKAIGIVLKGGYEFDSVVVDRFDDDNKVVSVRYSKHKERESHILVDEIAAILGPKSSTLFVRGVGQGS